MFNSHKCINDEDAHSFFGRLLFSTFPGTFWVLSDVRVSCISPIFVGVNVNVLYRTITCITNIFLFSRLLVIIIHYIIKSHKIYASLF